MSGDASKRLRDALKERGVKFAIDDGKHVKMTTWRGSDGRGATYAEYGNGECRFAMDACRITPEQAVVVTLGESHPYEQRITGDGSNWGEIMAVAYDSLMAAAAESCAPDELRAFESHVLATLGGGKAVKR